MQGQQGLGMLSVCEALCSCLLSKQGVCSFIAVTQGNDRCAKDEAAALKVRGMLRTVLLYLRRLFRECSGHTCSFFWCPNSKHRESLWGDPL
jgi:hypothetical protein